MASQDTEIKTVTAQCHCKSVHYKLSLKSSDLPLNVRLCHCSVCRWTHGTLCLFHATLPEGTVPEFIAPSSMDNLTAYQVTGGLGYFCSTCGCQTGAGDPKVKDMDVISTSLFAKDESVFKITSHCFTESAFGGGLNEWLPRIGDRELSVWNPKDERAAPIHSEAEYGANGEDRLRAQCHCGGVSFTIPRPTEEVINDPVMGPFVSPLDKSKWIATIDACDDCRLTAGTHVISWTFIPLDQCEPKIKPDLLIGTAKTYKSTPEVTRSFCGVCGAVVMYSHDERRPNGRQTIVDVAVGILRAPEGPRAENWLTWRTGRVGWEGDGLRYDEDFTKSLGEGFKKWGLGKYGEASTRT